MEGCNAVILAFGQTGTGKSLTIGGLQNTFQDRGIAPRILADLFQLKLEYKDKYKVCIKISYIETTRSMVVDLLTEDKEDVASFRNVTAIKVNNIFNALKVLFKAEGRRKMVNESHGGNGLLTLHVITKPLNLTNPEVKVSKLHLLDLAGVDIYGNVTSLYKTVFEVGGANTAKSQLEQFMLILCQNNPMQIHVKQRLNPILQYLGGALSTRSILRYIGHIRTDFDNLLVTLSLFRFGQIVRGLKPMKLYNNIIEDKETKFKIIEKQLQKSNIEKDLEVMMANHDLSTNLTQERLMQMQHVVDEYLHNKTNEIVLLSVTDATTVMQVFKNLYIKLENEKNECLKAAYDKATEDIRSTRTVLSKSESNPSTKSSKRSKKSKETLTGSRAGSLTKAHKKSISPVQSIAKSLEKKNLDSPRGSIRRSRNSSLIRKSGSRKRSSTSTNSVGTDVNDQLMLDSGLAIFVPGQKEAWNEFLKDPECHYQDLANNLETSEVSAKEIRTVYLEEVKKLQTLFDMVDLRKNDLQRVQMQRLLNKEELDKDNNVIISDTERHCLENVKQAHQELVTQQETVLQNQALYRIAIENYTKSKKAINEQFQLFCVDKYNTPMANPDLETPLSREVLQEETLISSVSLDVAASPVVTRIQLTEEAIHYEKLKILMKKQIEMTLRRKEAKRKWM